MMQYYSLKWYDQQDFVRLYFPTKSTEAETWGAPKADALGPTAEPFSGNDNIKLQLGKSNKDTEVLLQYYSDKLFMKSEDFVINACTGTDYRIIYGSVNISDSQLEPNYFLMQLTDSNSKVFARYENEVKSYFDRLFSSDETNFTGSHNVIIYSFSPGIYVNFAVETINDEKFSPDHLRSIMNNNMNITDSKTSTFTIDSSSLQVSGEVSCFESTFPENSGNDASQSEIVSKLEFALTDYCSFLRICQKGENIQVTNFSLTEIASIGGKISFCVDSILTERQIVEAVINEKFAISDLVTDFEFNYKVLPQQGPNVIIQNQKDSGIISLRELIWLCLCISLLLLVILALCCVVYYYCQYKQAQRHFQKLSEDDNDVANNNSIQVPIRNSTKMHKDAARASDISFILKTGPRQTFLRPESQVSVGGCENPNKSMPDLTYYSQPSAQSTFQKRPAGHLYTRSRGNQPNNSTSTYSRTPSDTNRAPTDRYSQVHDQEYDPLNYEYLRNDRSRTLPSSHPSNAARNGATDNATIAPAVNVPQEDSL